MQTYDFAEFNSLLEAQKRTHVLNHADSRIQATVNWLIKAQRSNGAWANDDIATTALCLLALNELSASVDANDLRSEIMRVTTAGAAFLVAKFSHNQWEHALWDTAVATRALLRVDPDGYRPFIQNRTDWIVDATERRGNHGPHHLAQALITLQAAGTHGDILAHRTELLVKAIGDSPSHYSPYVVSQCIEALCLLKHAGSELTRATDYIRSYLENARLDFASFINICYALQSLWLAPGKINMRTARVGTASLFGATCFRDTGSWYNSELFTASALITLARFSEEVVVRLPYSEAIYEFTQLRAATEQQFATLAKRHRRALAVHILSAMLWSGLLVFFIYYTTRNTDMWEWLKWMLWAYIVTLAGFNAHAVFMKNWEV